MKSSVPWNVKGVRPDAVETAREAARRSGMSLGEWLNDAIIDSAVETGMRLKRRGDDREHDRDGTVRRPRRPYPERDEALFRRPAAGGQYPRPAQPEPRRPAMADDPLAGINDRLDSLTRQLGKLATLQSAAVPSQPPVVEEEPGSRRLTEAIARLDSRLDEVIAEGRRASTEIERRVSLVDRTLSDLRAPKPSPLERERASLEQAVAEIGARQRELDGEAPLPPSAFAARADGDVRYGSTARSSSDRLPEPVYPGLASSGGQDFSGLQKQLEQLTTRMEELRRPCDVEVSVAALRADLAEIGHKVNEALPRQAIETLEGEVRSIAERLLETRQPGEESPGLTAIERGLGEVRDALRSLTPAENLVGLDCTVRTLAQKIDMMAAAAGPDPRALQQFEAAIASLRGIVSNVASNEAVAKVADDVRVLSAKVDQLARNAGSSDTLVTLERRIDTLAQALAERRTGERASAPDLEAAVQGLADKIEHMQLSPGDHAALSHLEDRIVKLVEKLDASDARLSQLEVIERGLADLLVQLEQLRATGAAGHAGPAVEMLKRDIEGLRETERRTQDSLEMMHGTLGHVVDRLAMLESDLRSGATAGPAAQETEQPAPSSISSASGPAAARPSASPSARLSAAAAMTASQRPAAASSGAGAPRIDRAGRTGERRPIDPTLPPDHPLEPGQARGRGISAADRIAASEAALGPAKPPAIPQPGTKANFIAAARRAAQSAAAAARVAGPEPEKAEEPAGGALRQRVGKHFKMLLLGGSVILILFGAWQVATNLLSNRQAPPAATSDKAADGSARLPPPDAAPLGDAARPGAPAADKQSSLPADPAARILASAGDVTGSIGALPQTAAASTPALTPGTAFGPPTLLLNAPASHTAPRAPAATTAAPVRTTSAAATPLAPETARPAEPAAIPVATTAPLAMPDVTALSPTPALAAPEKLPAAIGGPLLRKEAVDGNAAAEFEVAVRYADGRNVPQSLPQAAAWYERAADHGLAAAQFRLGSMYEKGQGVPRDAARARELYTAAAGKGHAKAMHNLAVLYAEGLESKPDFRMAAQWFHRAADHGIADSQYNLGILYARGVGVEQNLAESYKWFALAAQQGDTEANKKRDDIASRLDPQSLVAAKHAVQTFVADPQPEEATAVPTPPSGWDAVAEAKPAAHAHWPAKAVQ